MRKGKFALAAATCGAYFLAISLTATTAMAGQPVANLQGEKGPPGGATRQVAQANESSSSGRTVTVPIGTSVAVERMPEALCKIHLMANPSGSCLESIVTTVSPAEAPEAELLSTVSLSSAAAAATRCVEWTQLRRPADGSGLWQFGHNGKFCYDGAVAWYLTYKGQAGYHNCGYTQGVGFSVEIINCRESGNRTSSVRFDVTGKVCFLFRGSPLCTSYMPNLKGSRTGTITRFSDPS